MRSLLLAALLSCAITAHAALDLTPFPTEFEGEGVKYTELRFKDDTRRVTFTIPQNWTWRGSSSQVRLTPPATFTRADVTIYTAPLAAPQALDEKTIETLRQQFLTDLPAGSQGVKILSEGSPLLLSGNIPTWEFTATYQVIGQVYVRSTLFTNLSEMQLRCQLTTLKKDFDLLHRQFISSLVSWQWQGPAAPSTAGPNAASR